VAPGSGLNPLRGISQLEEFSFPIAVLPPFFYKEVVYSFGQLAGKDLAQKMGLRRCPLLDAVRTPPHLRNLQLNRSFSNGMFLCAHYSKGVCLTDPKSSTPETTSGEVEHEVSSMEGILLLVIEINFKDGRDHFAQVLLKHRQGLEAFLSEKFCQKQTSNIVIEI